MRTSTVTRSLVLLLTAGNFAAAGTYDVEPCLQVSQQTAGISLPHKSELSGNLAEKLTQKLSRQE
jgi:hypothetical protein